MVKIIEKNQYYYFQYSFRENSSTKTFEKYVGKEVPKNITMMQEEFEEEVFRKRFENAIEKKRKQNKKEIENMPQSYKNKYLSQFAIKFTYNSQAIEGSSLNFKDTVHLIEENINPNKDLNDIKLSKTHYKVFFEILQEKEISLKSILNWHKKLFQETYPDISGKIRNHNVKVLSASTVFCHYSKVEEELNEFFKWYDNNKNNIHPVRLAALSHLKFVTIHPFSDGNGRISRLLMNYILHKNDYPMLDIDYKKRKQYYDALERANSKLENYQFVDYIAKKYLKQIE
ncbi:MAG: Fic family protein [Candidatus Woesearchaeota archaeon]